MNIPLPECSVVLFVACDASNPRNDGSMPVSVYFFGRDLADDETFYDVINDCRLLATEANGDGVISRNAIEMVKKVLELCGRAVTIENIAIE
jgi:hypothetical protein